MPTGYSAEVCRTLWSIVRLMSTERLTRQEIISRLWISERLMSDYIGRLREIGIRPKYTRSDGCYSIDWPTTDVSLRLRPDQLFAALYGAHAVGDDAEDLMARICDAVDKS